MFGAPESIIEKIMVSKKTVAWVTNKLSILFTFILVYWTFVFISITVFDFKIFRENLTETFYLSVLGILAILLGSAILNVMTNIAIIAENLDKNPEVKVSGKKLVLGGLGIVLSFVLVFALLYWGDLENRLKKEKYLVASAEQLYHDNSDVFSLMDEYSFTPSFISKLSDDLRLLVEQDKNFQEVGIIVLDSIGNKTVFLNFGPNDFRDESKKPKKEDFIFPTNLEEKEYLNRIFFGLSKEMRYSAGDGNYELFYPVVTGPVKFVIFLSEHQQYGKFGS